MPAAVGASGFYCGRVWIETKEWFEKSVKLEVREEGKGGRKLCDESFRNGIETSFAKLIRNMISLDDFIKEKKLNIILGQELISLGFYVWLN